MNIGYGPSVREEYSTERNRNIDTHDDDTNTAFSCVPNNNNDVTDGVILSTTKKKTESIITNYAST